MESSPTSVVSTVTRSFSNPKLALVETTLQTALINFKDLVADFENLCIESENYKNELFTQKSKCESKNCSSSEVLIKIIESKDHIIQLVGNALTKLNATKNFSIVNEIFKIICGETTPLTPPKDSQEEQALEGSPIKELSILEDIHPDESVSEIEGTPTGRKSPIIQSKKLKSSTPNLNLRDKKKCPDNWGTPEKKTIKLSFPTPSRSKGNGRLRQSRLNLIKTKTTNMVDLTCSPELPKCPLNDNNNKQCNIKKELVDNDDTILPSPTSGPLNFQSMFKSVCKDSPQKKKSLSLKEKTRVKEEKYSNNENIPAVDPDATNMEESINILKQCHVRLQSPVKRGTIKTEKDLEVNESMSLLQNLNKFNNKDVVKQECISPSKRPLLENKNVTNVPQLDIDSSMSILYRVLVSEKQASNVDDGKRLKPNIGPVYKEPTVRKKAEKRALPGWSCDKCKNFYAELYKDNYEMLAKKMEECSRHRGRTDPVRPKTPPGYWNPRWEVPQDTEEFNRRNDAL